VDTGRGPKVSLSAAAVREGDTVSCALEPVPGPATIPELLEANTTRFPDHAAYREARDGEFADVTWIEFLRRVTALATFLHGRGVRPGDPVATVSRNRGELLVAEFAVMSLGAVFVPVFPGYSVGQTRGLLEHAGAELVFVSGSEQRAKVERLPGVRKAISFDDPGAWHHTPAVTAFAEAAATGHEPAAELLPRLRHLAAAVRPDSPSLMMFTSGTSGMQKGVVLTHDNILSQQRALARVWDVGPRDRMLCYLPWHHSFGGIFEKYCALYHGAPLAIDTSYGKDLALLLTHWRAVRPTLYFSVPLVHQELVNHVLHHPAEEPVIHGQLRFVFTAAAPLPAHVSEYLTERGIPIAEGWGLTETSPCCTLTDLREPRSVPGLVGYPIPGVRVRLAPDGEILVRGPNVMSGYHRNPEATAHALPGDGWFHTGDLGELHGSALKLVTRKDRVFKLLNAEKVIPTALENRLAGMNPYIRHVVVVGSGRANLAALVFPDFARIEQDFGDDRAEAATLVKESLLESIAELNRTHPVPYERIQAFAVVDRELSVEAGELTPSLKARVTEILRNTAGYVDAIYEPERDFECRYLGRVLRLAPDDRPCPHGKDVALDRCHECGWFLARGDALLPPA